MKFAAQAFALLLITSSLNGLGIAISAPRAADDNLTWEFARQRRMQIESVAYSLSFELQSGSETFRGQTDIALTLTPSAVKSKSSLSLDFLGKSVESVSINGKEVKSHLIRKGSIDIPFSVIAKNLDAKRSLTITVKHVSEFSKEGNGFLRSIDPEDKSEYLYTDFEPYQAHQLFPCFDQPDIKSIYTLTVKAPKKWKVIGNDLIAQSTPEGEMQITKFAPTKPLSPYLFFMGAGDYQEWKDEFKGTVAGTEVRLPLELYARKSLAKFVDHEEIFSITKKGLQFFGDAFGKPYPFPKYGQVFAPEFNWGGMENPGAVTLNERNIYRGPVNETRKIKRIDLILHEMAHMWFGDLVTMKWWNDLWLNESFATYASSLAMDRAMKVSSTWEQFFGSKGWGYWQDQLVTTHPIETKVGDVRTAKGNFDGVTYAKGAASLKQLHFYVGEKGFLDGLKSYFSKYAFKNATRQDFIDEIAGGSGVDLSLWTKSWLQSAGPQRVELSYLCDDRKIKNFIIQSKPNQSGSFAPHRTKIAFYRVSPGKEPALYWEEAVSYQAEYSSYKQFDGKECPDFIFSNKDDHDYAIFALNATSLENVESMLIHSPDSLLRVMIWAQLGQMVRDALLPPQQLVELAIKVLQHENTESVLNQILGRYSVLTAPYRKYMTIPEREQIAPALEAILWQRFASAERGSSLQITFFEAYTRMAQTTIGLQKLADLLKGERDSATLSQIKGLEIDQDKRWSIVEKLAAGGYPEASALIAAEELKDTSSQGRESALSAKVAIPNLESKKKYWGILKAPEKLPKDMPRSEVESAAGWFHLPNHPEISQNFVKEYFQIISTRDWRKDDTWVEYFFGDMFPEGPCSAEILKTSVSALGKSKHLTDLARRMWREANDELGRCVTVRKKWAKAAK